MAYTKFAEYVRILRIKNHQSMSDMAELLNVSTPFLSAVESGKKNVPETWLDTLTDYYCLNEADVYELRQAIDESRTTAKMDLVSATPIKRQVALRFQRSFDDINEETAKKILELLGD